MANFGKRFETLGYKTLDGIFIRGWFYSVEGKAPAIIMSHGVRQFCNEHTSKLTDIVQLHERDTDN